MQKPWRTTRSSRHKKRRVLSPPSLICSIGIFRFLTEESSKIPSSHLYIYTKGKISTKVVIPSAIRLPYKRRIRTRSNLFKSLLHKSIHYCRPVFHSELFSSFYTITIAINGANSFSCLQLGKIHISRLLELPSHHLA